MLKFLTGGMLAVTAFAGLALSGAPASAMPMIDRAPAVVAAGAAPLATPEQVRWVCGPYRCFHRPNFYGPRFYHPGWHRPFWHGGYGWHRHFGHRWHHWR